jgi:hypothetical protein
MLSGCGAGGAGSGVGTSQGAAPLAATSVQSASPVSVASSSPLVAANSSHGAASKASSGQSIADVASLTPLNLAAGACSVPDQTNASDVTCYKQFDFGQLYGTACTIDASWTPADTLSNGIMAFRSSFYGNDGYVLSIAPSGSISVSINANHQNLSGMGPGKSADGLAPPALNGATGPCVLTPSTANTNGGPQSTFNFQLQESGNVFTVIDNNDNGAVALSVTDPAIAGDTCSYAGVEAGNVNTTAFCDGPTLWIGTNQSWSNPASGRGTWNHVTVTQAGTRTPQLGAAALVAPDTDQDARSIASNEQMTNHFGVDQQSCEENVVFSAMFSPSATQDMGQMTCHRENVAGSPGQSLNYALHVCANRLILTKNLGPSTPATVLATCPIPVNGGQLVRGTQLPLQLSVDDTSNGVLLNVNLIDMTTPPQSQAARSANQAVNTSMSPSPAPGATTNQPTTYATLVRNLMSYQDNQAPYAYGYQFGFYTNPGAKLCWDDATLIRH